MKKVALHHSFVATFLALLCIEICSTAAIAEPVTKDETVIRQVLKSTWDKSESPLNVEPVVIVSGHALAGWTQGARGGRALLAKQKDGSWIVQACGGDGLKEVKTLEQSDLTPAVAQSLAHAATTAEAKLPAATRAQFSTFDQPLATPSEHKIMNNSHH